MDLHVQAAPRMLDLAGEGNVQRRRGTVGDVEFLYVYAGYLIMGGLLAI
jgi:hypothetical protein